MKYNIYIQYSISFKEEMDFMDSFLEGVWLSFTLLEMVANGMSCLSLDNAFSVNRKGRGMDLIVMEEGWRNISWRFADCEMWGFWVIKRGGWGKGHPWSPPRSKTARPREICKNRSRTWEASFAGKGNWNIWRPLHIFSKTWRSWHFHSQFQTLKCAMVQSSWHQCKRLGRTPTHPPMSEPISWMTMRDEIESQNGHRCRVSRQALYS